ncbi:MAG: hypothetical protein QOF90_3793, partial [Acetobacteraceae bacterium]|nr:hypothetical protein [Acetobacteraceae bacterium]
MWHPQHSLLHEKWSDPVTVSDSSRLGFEFSFNDLAARDGLIRLDRLFLRTLAEQDTGLQQRLLAARAEPDGVVGREESDLVVALGPHLDGFLA